MKKDYRILLSLYAYFICISTVCSQEMTMITDSFETEIKSLAEEQMPADALIKKVKKHQQALLTRLIGMEIENSAYDSFFERLGNLCEWSAQEGTLSDLKEWFTPFTQLTETSMYPGEGKLCFYLGREYLSQGDFDTSEHYFLLALPIMEQYEDELLWKLYANLGLSYKERGLYEKAISYNFKSIKCLEGNDSRMIPAIYNNISTAFLQNGSLDSANKYVELCINGTENRNILHHAYANKGRIYQYRGMIEGDLNYYQMAIEQHDKALEIRKEIKTSNKDFFNSYINLGANHEYLGQFALAQNYYNLALGYDGKQISPGLRIQLQKNMADVYLKKGEYKKAIESVESLIDSMNINSFGKIEHREKLLTIENLESNLDVYKSSKLKVDLLTISIVLAVVCIMLISLVFTERMKRLKTQQEKMNMINQHANELIEERVELQDKIFKQIGRELHDDVQNFIIAWKMRLEKISNKEAANKLDILYNKIRDVSHQLNPVVLYGPFMPALRELAVQFSENSSYKVDLYSLDIEGRIFAEKVQYNIYRIVQEALTNIEKHAPTAHKVVIQLIHHVNNELGDEMDFEEFISLTIEDDGQGFDSNKYTPGLGLSNMKDRAEELGGTFEIDSSPGRGTIILIKIPAEVKGLDVNI